MGPAAVPIITAVGSAVASGVINNLLAPKPKGPSATGPSRPAPSLAPGPAPAQTSFQRPGAAGEVPLSLRGAGISPTMSPLQQRTAIATGVTQGQGVPRDPSTIDYYRNVALQSLLDPTGNPIPGQNFTPVERQMFGQVEGLNPDQYTGEDMNRYLTALSNYDGTNIG